MKGQDIAAGITEHLQTALSKSLSSMTGQQFRVAADGSSAISEPLEPILWQQEFSSVPGPALWVLADAELWKIAGELTLAAVGIDTVTDEDCRSTWQEIVSQVMGSFCTSLSSDLNREITATRGVVISDIPSEPEWIAFSATNESGRVWKLNIAWSPALPALYEVPDADQKSASTRDSPFSKTFDLLLDVALPVSVSFGKTSLQIREVLKLSTGSIVELNRFVAEPVEVVVNDCVIARGEVVVVDGNYGVRITQLSSREERIRFGMAETASRNGAPLR